MTKLNSCALVEVFSSIQGEGLFVGCRQIFIRLAGCNLHCSYCDTQGSQAMPAAARIERIAGERNFFSIPNPVALDELTRLVLPLFSLPHHSISFTGGEPLCQPEAVAYLASHLPGRKILETNGVLAGALRQVLPDIDVISMDIKLPSSTGRDYWREHEEFLRLAVQKQVYVKVVVTRETDRTEVDKAIDLIARISREIPLILQPVTTATGIWSAPSLFLRLQERALHKLADVRVIPQTHQILGQL